MRKNVLTFVLLLCATLLNAQTILKGDMNDDGDITISDAVDIVNIVLGNALRQTINIGGNAYEVDNAMVVGTWYCSDGTTLKLREDGTTNYGTGYTYKFRPTQGTILFSDASGTPKKTLVMNEVEDDYMLSVDYATGTYKYYRKLSSDHAFVDLGLPSGTLWATCNIGANSREEYGDYFSWGETTGLNSGKTNFAWTTYKWCNGTYNTLTKYNDDSHYGIVDKKSVLDPEDDAAYVLWGTSWRMPTKEQWEELINTNNTTLGSITVNGVYCHKLTSKVNGNSITLPNAGYYYDKYSDVDGPCQYWSRTSKTNGYPSRAYYVNLRLSSSIRSVTYGDRKNGHPIRPVLVIKK